MAVEAAAEVPATREEVREQIVEALELDLVGPSPGHELAEEHLPGWVRPSNWYLTGFLIPVSAPSEQSADLDADEDVDETPETGGEESTDDAKSAKKGFFPSSMGLSFLVSKDADSLEVTVRWGDYERGHVGGTDGDTVNVWKRVPREAALTLVIGGSGGARDPQPVPESGGLELHLLERLIPPDGLDHQIPEGTRSVSLFFVNERPARTDEPDRAFVFQPEIEVRSARGFVPRPDLRRAQGEDWDDQMAELHYADTPEYATGHGVSADWALLDGACALVRTAWVPKAEVEKTETAPIDGVELSMLALGALADGAAAGAALRPLVEHYRAWIAGRLTEAQGLPTARRETAEELLRLASIAADRIERGIAIVAEDADALDAFRVANRAVARALINRLRVDAPAWRPFQLAFILLNLPGMADPADPHRRTVDLLFFPTGGGKTEAYLGLSAFAMVLRRLRHPGAGGRAGAGVSVIMRYTLRLLTLDQLSRAAGLVCALELERADDPERYGEWPFEIGLWVGKAATPNKLGSKGEKRSDSARAKVRRYKSNPGHSASPIPLESCPWCETDFSADSFTLLPNDDHPRELRIVCTNFECDFSGDSPLPIVAVDEELYRRLPAFLVATVDKFASLPWFAESGALLGGATRQNNDGFYGAATPGRGTALPAPLPPPDLIIQDELHLISGPLGTMAGLYEVAIEGLCAREVEGRTVLPKIVASTATVRRAQDQIQALFGRPITQIFPPPGPGRRDSFFAHTVPASRAPARRYVGIAAQGRNPKVVMRKVWLALMGAAERAYRDAGGHQNAQNPADPYMTVIGYFNSLRELGGARRILEEEVQNTLKAYGSRRRIGESPGLFRDRKTFSAVVELTSRVPTDQVAEARRRLGAGFDQPARVDCAIATNMISVGLDIPRLGLMGVLGQPKTAAEYIQATSRVGRVDAAPGLVVTVLNIHKPRDRSHYERFRHFHETFYRSVEVGSVTPFSARALDRGVTGAVVALARNLDPLLTPPKGAGEIAAVRGAVEKRLLELFLDRVDGQDLSAEEREERRRSVQDRIVDLLDSWRKVVDDYGAEGVEIQYQKYELETLPPLLREMLDTEFESEHHRKFRVNRSLRDVEPEVNLFLKELTGTQAGAAS
jgi:hypothetical protein